MKLWPRKRKPDPVAEAVEEQSALSRSALSRVDRVLRHAAETLGGHAAETLGDKAMVDAYTQAERERTGR